MHKNTQTLALIVKSLYKDRPFQLGFLIKLLAVILLVPKVQHDWFTPFVGFTLHHPSLDPWSVFLKHGGDSKAFPYGIIMYLFHLPFVALGIMLDSLFHFKGFSFAQTGFALSLLAADIALCITMIMLYTGRSQHIILFYWFSPIVLYVTYWHGQTDIVPILFITLSLLFLKQQKFSLSAISLSSSIAAKLSSILAAPFIILFLLKNKRYEYVTNKFIVIFFVSLFLFQGIFFLSDGVQAMLLASPEIDRVYDLSFVFNNGSEIYIVPLLYIILVYCGWRIGCMNTEFLYAFMGSSFFIILLCTPAAVGWFLWIVPFIVLFQPQASKQAKLVIICYSLVFVAYNLLVTTGASIPIINWELTFQNIYFPQHIISILLSILTALGLIIAVSILRHAIKNNDYYHLSRQPIAIGIAGDSSTGKDTLSQAIIGLFGKNRTVEISGDDYHLFERKDLRWTIKTHLHPLANDLHLFVNNSLKLLKGKNIYCRHYDHSKGLFSEPTIVHAKDVVIISGLHALFSDLLRKRFNVSVFLNMDEDLRRYLKIKRDVYERGHSIQKVAQSLKERLKDKDAYIMHQKQYADIIFSLQPVHPLPNIEEMDLRHTKLCPLKLSIIVNTSIDYRFIHKQFVSLLSTKMSISSTEDKEKIEILIEGDNIKGYALAKVAYKIIPNIQDILTLVPQWSDGLLGVMQLFILLQLASNANEKN